MRDDPGRAEAGAARSKGPPSAALRKDRLTRAIDLLLTHQDELVDAIDADFGARSRDLTLLDRHRRGAIGPLEVRARTISDGWMKPQKRKVSPAALGLFGAKAEVRYQPKGVVGVISPWNFPVQLAFDADRGRVRGGQPRHAEAVGVHAGARRR